MGVGLAIGTDAMRACAVAPRWRGLRLRWCGLARLPRELIRASPPVAGKPRRRRASPREENIASVAGFRRHLGTVLRGLWGRRRLRVGLPDRAARVRVVFADELPQDPAACRKYLLWRLADALDCRPEDSRLAYMALPNPLPGPRLAVTCAVTGVSVARQYERALAESRIRYAGIAPTSTQRCGSWIDQGAATLRSRGRPRRLQGKVQAPGPPRGPYREGRAAAPLELSPRTVRFSLKCRPNIATHSVLLFNFFQPQITAPPGVPALFLAASDETLTTVLALDGCPIFWRTRALAPLEAAGGGWDNGRRGDLVRDITEAVVYGEAKLGMDPPGRVLVTGPPTEVPGLARWLAAQVGLPTTCLEARTLLRRAPRPLPGDGWHRWAAALGAATRQ